MVLGMEYGDGYVQYYGGCVLSIVYYCDYCDYCDLLCIIVQPRRRAKIPKLSD